MVRMMMGGPRVLSRQLKIRSTNGVDRTVTAQRLRHEVQVLRATVQEYEQAHAVLLAEAEQLRAENRHLWELLETAVIRTKELAQSLFGRKSERQVPSAPATLPPPPSTPTGEAPAEPSPALSAGNASPLDPPAAPESASPPAAAEPSASSGRRRGQQPGTPGHGRRRYRNLPARHRYLGLSDEELQCPICGVFAQDCGEEISEQIDFVVRLELLITHRKRYRYPCHCRELADSLGVSGTASASDAAGSADGGAPSQAPVSGTVNAPEGSVMPGEAGETTALSVLSMPAVSEATDDGSAAPVMSATSGTTNEPAAPVMPAASEISNERGPRTLIAPRPLSVIPRGLFTINFLVQLLIWKYVVGVPLHRLRKVWASQGTNIAAGTLAGTLKTLGEILEPLYEAIREVNRQEPWWHADETHWKVFIEYIGKVGHRWWLWVFKGPHSTVFITTLDFIPL